MKEIDQHLMIFNNMLGLKKDEKELKETQLDYDSS